MTLLDRGVPWEYIVSTMLFFWDPTKDDANVRKHGVSFELAQTVFDDPLHLSVPDGKTTTEERWITLGLAADRRTLVVVHTYREQRSGEEVVRIISARPATRQEKKQYEEGI